MPVTRGVNCNWVMARQNSLGLVLRTKRLLDLRVLDPKAAHRSFQGATILSGWLFNALCADAHFMLLTLASFAGGRRARDLSFAPCRDPVVRPPPRRWVPHRRLGGARAIAVAWADRRLCGMYKRKHIFRTGDTCPFFSFCFFLFHTAVFGSLSELIFKVPGLPRLCCCFFMAPFLHL